MFRVTVSNRYGYIQAYITEIVFTKEYTRGEADYKVVRIVAGVNVPDRVGRNTYPYKQDGIEDLFIAKKKCLQKVFTIK